MALQEVCGFNDTSYLHPQWNIVSSASVCSQDAFLFNTRQKTDFGGLFTRSSVSPLELYVPIAEYLQESPLQFGQASPIVTPQAPVTPEHCLASLPPLSAIIPLLSASSSVPLPFQLSHGTTTLAFQFQGGVIAAADTRSSCAGLVACPASQKVLPIHSHLVGTTSGTSADCALWKRILARELRLYQLRHGRRLPIVGAAKLLSHMLHPFKGTELCVAATLCGWDCADGGAETVTGSVVCSLPVEEEVEQETMSRDRECVVVAEKSSRIPPIANPQQQHCRPSLSGPKLVYVCSDGTRLQGELFSVGSGSPYAYSILDRDVHWEMSLDEAVAVAREAVYRATHRDAYSGNNVDLYHVTASGWRRRERENLKEEYYREKAREREEVAERRRQREQMETLQITLSAGSN